MKSNVCFEGRLAIRCYIKGSTSLRFESNTSNSILDLGCCEKPMLHPPDVSTCRRDLPPSRSLRGLWLGQLRYVGVWTCQKYPKCGIHGTDFPQKGYLFGRDRLGNIDHRIHGTNGICTHIDPINITYSCRKIYHFFSWNLWVYSNF